MLVTVFDAASAHILKEHDLPRIVTRRARNLVEQLPKCLRGIPVIEVLGSNPAPSWDGL